MGYSGNAPPVFELRASIRVEARTPCVNGNTDAIRGEMTNLFAGLQRYLELAGYDVGDKRLALTRKMAPPGEPLRITLEATPNATH